VIINRAHPLHRVGFVMRSRCPMPRRLVLLVLPLALISTAPGQEKKKAQKPAAPRVLYAVPLVVRAGERQKLTLRGQQLDGVKEVKVGGAERATVKVLAGKKAAVPANYPAAKLGDTEVEVELELTEGAKPGGVTLTAVGPAGESPPYTLLIADGLPAMKEKEPNDGFAQAQPVPVPCAIEGTVKGERDADVFRIEGKKGDRVRFEVQAARYGSPADLLVTLYDAGRRVVAAADDTDGSPDPVLVVTLPHDGAYYLGVIEAHDLGGPQFGYRLVVRKDE
jgi:hypothetical protein